MTTAQWIMAWIPDNDPPLTAPGSAEAGVPLPYVSTVGIGRLPFHLAVPRL